MQNAYFYLGSLIMDNVVFEGEKQYILPYHYYSVEIAVAGFGQDDKQDVVVRFVDSLGIGVLFNNRTDY